MLLFCYNTELYSVLIHIELFYSRQSCSVILTESNTDIVFVMFNTVKVCALKKSIA